jgi:hypothetical protein
MLAKNVHHFCEPGQQTFQKEYTPAMNGFN